MRLETEKEIMEKRIRDDTSAEVELTAKKPSVEEIKLTKTFLDGMKWGILLSAAMWVSLGCLIGRYLWR
jgi:hypothetical protein